VEYSLIWIPIFKALMYLAVQKQLLETCNEATFDTLKVKFFFELLLLFFVFFVYSFYLCVDWFYGQLIIGTPVQIAIVVIYVKMVAQPF
jgi:hypothetical protein